SSSRRAGPRSTGFDPAARTCALDSVSRSTRRGSETRRSSLLCLTVARHALPSLRIQRPDAASGASEPPLPCSCTRDAREASTGKETTVRRTRTTALAAAAAALFAGFAGFAGLAGAGDLAPARQNQPSAYR